MFLQECFGAPDGLVGCHTCSVPDGPIGSLWDSNGCIDDYEITNIALSSIALIALIFYAHPRAHVTLAIVGAVVLLSSQYHLLFGEGVGRAQPTITLDVTNSRVFTIPVQCAITAWLVGGLTNGAWFGKCIHVLCCQNIINPGVWNACYLYSLAANGVAVVAWYDNGNFQTIYGVFDAAGVVLGAAIIYRAFNFETK